MQLIDFIQDKTNIPIIDILYKNGLASYKLKVYPDYYNQYLIEVKLLHDTQLTEMEKHSSAITNASDKLGVDERTVRNAIKEMTKEVAPKPE